VVFFRQHFQTLKEEQNFAWSQIQILHDNDIQAYPKHIPTNPNRHNWTFCFNKIELFFNVSTPHYEILKNRNLGSYITFVVNPRENFDFVASNETKQGRKMREIIRKRVKNYNSGILPNELGFFGDESKFEWKQYVLNEPNTQAPNKCPLKIRSEKC